MILIDTREPEPSPWEHYFSVPTNRGTLSTGDYSLIACEHLVAVERKTLPDLIGCLCTGRDRFERELARAQAILHFWVICEGSYRDILAGNFRSQMSPEAAFQSIVALMTRYRIPFLMANDAATAARLCESLLLKWYREHQKIVDTVRKAQGLRIYPRARAEDLTTHTDERNQSHV
jgi:DNA excision repair protein ERCC-4